MQIAPSLLAANFKDLKNELERVENADFLHLDIMDGHFVPNISFGPFVVGTLREISDLTFDVHLMLTHPLNYIESFANAGADIISFHIECESDIKETIEKIKSFGVKPALVIKPGTNVEEVFPYCDDISMVLIMSVEPGFGGQKMMPEQLEKVKILKEKFPNLLVEVDGGIDRSNIEMCKDFGTDICVCGTSVFGAENPKGEIDYFRSV